MHVTADFDAKLTAGDVTFAERDAELLRTVDDEGSLNRAADALGRSYSRAHERLTALESAFGPLVERRRGGPGGGGSVLTADARELLARYDRLLAGYEAIAEAIEAVLAGTVTERTGELGTVETPAGTLLAIVTSGRDAVEVSIRADAVTLHEPNETPPPGATSARNRFEGEVVELERGEAVSLVRVDVGADAPLFALVTETSRDRLDLAVGQAVVASFKATATRATPRDRDSRTSS